MIRAIETEAAYLLSTILRGVTSQNREHLVDRLENFKSYFNCTFDSDYARPFRMINHLALYSLPHDF
jgi:hypothetical protein